MSFIFPQRGESQERGTDEYCTTGGETSGVADRIPLLYTGALSLFFANLGLHLAASEIGCGYHIFGLQMVYHGWIGHAFMLVISRHSQTSRMESPIGGGLDGNGRNPRKSLLFANAKSVPLVPMICGNSGVVGHFALPILGMM